jgi:hypothetical protein
MMLETVVTMTPVWKISIESDKDYCNEMDENSYRQHSAAQLSLREALSRHSFPDGT